MKSRLETDGRFSKPHLIIFLLVFAAVGGVVLLLSHAAPNPNLQGDLNNDNVVNSADLAIMIANFGTTFAGADINQDGIVNGADFSALLANYGRSVSGGGTISASTSAHNIDGSLSEADWNIITPASKCVIGTCNNNVTYGTLWDNSYLYVGVKVLDSNLKNDSTNCWDDDSVEVYIDPTAAGGTTYTAQDRQIVQRYNDANLCAGVGSNSGVLHAWVPITGGYSVELAIPWSNLGVIPTSGMTIGFDIGNNDDDDGGARDAQTIGFGTISDSSDPSGFGQFKLTGSPVSAPTVSLSANPTTINAGASSTLTWSSTNATSCSAAWTASHATSGSASVSPGGTTTYSIACTGAGGTTTKTSTVTVNGGGTTGMLVGVNETGWGIGGVADLSGSVKFARVDTGYSEPITDYSSNGVKVLPVIPGTCPTCAYDMANGVSGINASSWASSALSWYQANCTTTECPGLEVLNEPGGSWFWGSNALSTTNAAAYANLLVTVYTTFHNQYGASAPKIVASYDGGYSGGSVWGSEVMAANSSINNYVDEWTVHPYGGSGNNCDANPTLSAQGDRNDVMNAHAATGKPIYITEVGWPTAVGQGCTGDSLQWTEAQQADNIYNFVQWARSTGYVDAVIIFQYRDYGSNDWYGIEHADGTKKPSYNTLKCAAQNLAEGC